MAQAKVDTKAAIEEINKLINSYTKLVEATGQVSTISQGNFKKVEQALAALKIMTDQATASIDKMTDAQKQELAATRARTKGVNDVTDAMKKEAKAVQEVVDAQKKLENQSGMLGRAFKSVLKGAGELIAAFGVVAGLKLFAGIIQNAYALTKQFDSLAFSLEKITKDSNAAAVSQRFLLQITEDFGVELLATTQRWIKFLAASKQAGVTLKDTEDIFSAVTKAASVLGLQTDELSTIYLALEQMMSKGKITTEELRRQLGEKLPGAVGIMAAAVGVNVNELDKMLKKGELLSAEVLPKFAKALEAAYGIQTVEKIDTVMAAQNRLTNAWELFVKSVMEGGGWIAQTLNGMAIMMKGIAKLFMDEDQKLQLKIIEEQKDFQGEYEYQAELFYDKIVKNEEKMYYLRNVIWQKQEALKSSTGQDTVRLNKELDELQIAYAKGTEKILNIQKHKAQREIEQAKADFITKRDLYKKYQRDGEDVPEEVANQYAHATAKLEYLKKLLEVSTASKFKPEEPKKKEIPKKYLDEIRDLGNEEEEIRLNSRQKINDAIIKSDKTSLDEQIAAIVENGDIRLKLADTQYNEALEKAKTYYDKELGELTRAQAEGKIIIGDTEKYKADLKQNYADQVSMATSKKNDALLANEKEFDDDMVSIGKKREDLLIRDIKDAANEKILIAQEVYANSSKTSKDKAALDKKLNEIAIEQANAVIDIQIQTLENMKTISGVTKTEVDTINSLILQLQASRKTLSPDKDVKEKLSETQENLIKLYEFIGEVSNSINDLGQAIFDRRIENINAEINAEKDKYDRLIEMAAGNKDEQVRLQREKDAKIKELEDKRLKEERKKAIFDKANALIQIAVNTAVAITKAAAQTGVGFIATTPVLIALGALQAAAVLAQPLPKYKDGLPYADRDHTAVINDGGRQEYVERDGNILTTSTKNAIINLKKGDTVHKSYDDLVASSDILSNLSRSMFLKGFSSNNDSDNHRIEIMLGKQMETIKDDIKKGIHEGFNKVTINNTTKIDMDWIKYKNDTL